MAKEKGLKHKEILKCIRCREDKQKCLPFPRGWPGTKCNRCKEHGYQCSKPLSARNQKLEREAQENAMAAMAAAHADSPDRYYDNGSSRDVEYIDDGSMAPVHIMFPQEPMMYRNSDNTACRLLERMVGLWASPETFQSACSSTFAAVITEFLARDTRQIGLVDDMVNHAVIAFSAGDATLGPQTLYTPQFNELTHSHANKALAMLRVRLASSWPTLNDASVMLTAFHLFLYGICVNDIDLLKSMSNIIQTYNQYNTGFPMSTTIHAYEDGSWVARIFMQDHPEDPGLVLRHNTNTFLKERLVYDTGVFSLRPPPNSQFAVPNVPVWKDGSCDVPVDVLELDMGMDSPTYSSATSDTPRKQYAHPPHPHAHPHPHHHSHPHTKRYDETHGIYYD